METTSAQARSARDWVGDVLVDTHWLSEHLGDAALRVVEVDVSPARFQEGHIPGATLWDIYGELKDADYRLVDRAAIREVVERSGIAPDSTVVFYGYAPALGFWLMKLFGHADARVLDATRETWQDGGLPWTADVESPERAAYALPDEDDRIRVRLNGVRDAITNPHRVIVDTRSAAEYEGERFWPSGGMEDGGRAGHIPSAVLVPADGIHDTHGAFKSAAELHRLYEPVGVDDEDEVITYCTIGARACTTWFALTYALGHERTRVYDGSWAEWGREPATPVERDARR
ncbi:MAG TPA: sulfurtransferase [Acidimicrobiia bacterium]|nr:sulfurtransferase [Acidimicrobiia bacterium]